MASDATGTPTSPDNIPTFNTSVDAPSGLGSNAQMAAIQTALSARVSKPSGIVTGEAVVWNGSAWVRSSATGISTVTNSTATTITANPADLAWSWGVANIAFSEIGTGGGSLRSLGAPPTGAGARVILRNTSGSAVAFLHATAGGSGAQLFMRSGASVTLASNESLEFVYDGTFWVEVNRDQAVAAGFSGPGAPATTLPGSPTDGQQAILTDNTTTPTYAWLVQWNAASSKWWFIGGSPVTVAVDTSEATAGTGAYTDLTTVGPSFTAPRAGTYKVNISSQGNQNSTGNIKIGLKVAAGAVAAATEATYRSPATGANSTFSSGWYAVSGVNASDVMKIQYHDGGGVGTFAVRKLTLVPLFLT